MQSLYEEQRISLLSSITSSMTSLLQTHTEAMRCEQRQALDQVRDLYLAQGAEVLAEVQRWGGRLAGVTPDTLQGLLEELRGGALEALQAGAAKTDAGDATMPHVQQARRE